MAAFWEVTEAVSRLEGKAVNQHRLYDLVGVISLPIRVCRV